MKARILILSMAALLLSAGRATAAVAFDDKFDNPTLAPEWQLSPGKGAFSLTSNPGHLRYTIDAYLTSRAGGYDQFGNYYDKVLWLVRPFEGSNWIVKTVVTYDLRPGQPTNNRNLYFTVREPGADGKWIAYVTRWIGANDDNPGSNAMTFCTGDPADTPTSPLFPNAPGPLPPETWYFEIERSGDHIAIRASNDGDNSTFEYVHEHTFPAGYLQNGHQEIEIEGSGWRGSNAPPGYADFDYIKVEPTCPTVTITQQPVSQSVSNGQDVTFSVVANGNGPLHYHWRRNGEYLSNGGHYSGVDTNTLVVNHVTPSEVGAYELWIGTEWTCLLGKTSDPATLSLTPIRQGDIKVSSE